MIPHRTKNDGSHYETKNILLNVIPNSGPTLIEFTNAELG